MSMGIIESYGGGDVFWILEFSDATFEACNGLAHDLSASLALSVIVFAVCTLLGLGALLARRLAAIAALEIRTGQTVSE